MSTVTGRAAVAGDGGGLVAAPSLDVKRRARALVAGAVLVCLGALAVTPAGAFAKALKPTISALSVSPSAVTDGNGWVTLSATVANASNCTFTGKRTLTELPATVPCSSGTVTEVVDLPRNAGKKTAKFTFKAAVVGPGGKKTAKVSATVEPGAGGTPGPLSGVASVVSNRSGGYCALLASSEVDCWGYGASKGGIFGYTEVPVAIRDLGGSGHLSGVTRIASDGGSYCALLATTQVDCWGAESKNVPTPVAGVGGTGTLSGVTSLEAAAEGHVLLRPADVRGSRLLGR